MKKTSNGKRAKREEMKREYRLDYRKSRSNRFASRMKDGAIAVVLDPDVASVFQSPETVNSLLRSVIHAFPKHS
ncbi:MAG TPA: hypothetical protein VFM21_01975 [Terriglobia bacterium]|nr:hypothetical protein [Terriglobia bacterium]